MLRALGGVLFCVLLVGWFDAFMLRFVLNLLFVVEYVGFVCRGVFVCLLFGLDFVVWFLIFVTIVFCYVLWLL